MSSVGRGMGPLTKDLDREGMGAAAQQCLFRQQGQQGLHQLLPARSSYVVHNKRQQL